MRELRFKCDGTLVEVRQLGARRDWVLALRRNQLAIKVGVERLVEDHQFFIFMYDSLGSVFLFGTVREALDLRN